MPARPPPRPLRLPLPLPLSLGGGMVIAMPIGGVIAPADTCLASTMPPAALSSSSRQVLCQCICHGFEVVGRIDGCVAERGTQYCRALLPRRSHGTAAAAAAALLPRQCCRGCRGVAAAALLTDLDVLDCEPCAIYEAIWIPIEEFQLAVGQSVSCPTHGTCRPPV